MLYLPRCFSFQMLLQHGRCVRITDEGVITMANSWTSLEFLSLFGIVGVTDRCLETLSQTCSATLTTLDANGCIGIKSKLGGGSQQQGQRVSYNKSKLTLGLRTVKIDKVWSYISHMLLFLFF
ncbi:PREDICTED: uncharacterized protein LOC109129966 [Camelina sativa]|uniref:Uncharacterized protein LOC109129966 n=1 Tax=Camelina sativa TaxID=90675 RepID=A0ABM1R6D3_CAMSA|nr:PREDICTED: uncharacterized protein LOC109129966 [Camelina sativa]